MQFGGSDNNDTLNIDVQHELNPSRNIVNVTYAAPQVADMEDFATKNEELAFVHFDHSNILDRTTPITASFELKGGDSPKGTAGLIHNYMTKVLKMKPNLEKMHKKYIIMNLRKHPEYKRVSDRVDAYCDALKEKGVVIKKDFKCCTKCGHHKMKLDKHDRGYGFYHRRETDRIIDQIIEGKSKIKVGLGWDVNRKQLNNIFGKVRSRNYDDFVKLLSQEAGLLGMKLKGGDPSKKLNLIVSVRN